MKLVQEHRLLLYKVCRLYCFTEADRQDLFQEIVIQLWRSYPKFRGESKFSTWLFTIVRTSCITFLRKKKLDITSIDDERTFVQLESRESAFKANTIEQRSRHAMVNSAIRMLSPDDAQLLSLFYKGEQSLEEIGKIMHLDPNTVKVKLHRARHRLKDKMEKHFSHEVREIQGE